MTIFKESGFYKELQYYPHFITQARFTEFLYQSSLETNTYEILISLPLTIITPRRNPSWCYDCQTFYFDDYIVSIVTYLFKIQSFKFKLTGLNFQGNNSEDNLVKMYNKF